MYAKLTVQERLKDLRVERNLTLEDLAEATGLSKSALGDYENNEDKDINGYAIKTPQISTVSPLIICLQR